MIRTKRAYDDPATEDGRRFLVDRYWPRGVSKEELRVEDWLREVAPSDELREWFDHDPERWEEFKRRYFTELEQRSEALQVLIEAASEENVTLVYGASDTRHNNAEALKEYLETVL